MNELAWLNSPAAQARATIDALIPDEHWALVRVVEVIQVQIPHAEILLDDGCVDICQPHGPDVLAVPGQTLRIASGRVELASATTTQT